MDSGQIWALLVEGCGFSVVLKWSMRSSVQREEEVEEEKEKQKVEEDVEEEK